MHRYLARAEDHGSHTGGGTDPSALFNGTTHNGSGGEDTLDDDRTFRGYGSGDWLVLSLMKGSWETGKYGFDVVTGLGWNAEVGRDFCPLNLAEPRNAADLVAGRPVTAAARQTIVWLRG